MGININLPIVVNVDNMGAVYIAQDGAVSQRTKHVDMRTKFLAQHAEDGCIKIVFVRSEKNLSDMFTKNVTGEIYDSHSKSYVGTKEELNASTE